MAVSRESDKAQDGTNLVLNAGSSSIKFSLFQGGALPSRQRVLCRGAIDGIGHRIHFTATDGDGRKLADRDLDDAAGHEDALAMLLHWVAQQFAGSPVGVIGHRVVHGGPRYAAPVRVADAVIAELHRLVPLAPLHQPHHLAAIAAVAQLYPGLPQIACFDTAFHHAMPPVAAAFALPRSLAAEGVRRYGFHGISYEYIAHALPQYLGREAADGRVVVAHLGSGASLCALRERKSIATTMGLTPLDGLMMGRRCGTLDPGVVLYLLQQKKLPADAIADLLYDRSGLYGVSGVSDDMRVLLDSAEPHAAEAIDLFVYRVSRELGSLAAALGGLDALVFTGGIGEHAAEIRRRVCIDAAWLGIELDERANAAGGPCLTSPGSRASAWMIPTDEDLMIAQHSWRLVYSDVA